MQKLLKRPHIDAKFAPLRMSMKDRTIHSKFLRYFDEVARQGSIRKAAALLNVSSTTINRKLISVEDDLGVRLFDRTSDGVTLTTAGSAVVEHCRKTIYDFERLQELVGDIRDLRSEHIEIMAVDSAAFGLFPVALARFSENYPGVTYSVTTALPDETMDAVGSGAVDLAFTFTNELHPDVRVLGEKAAPIGAIMRPDHPLAERTILSIEDLMDYPLIRSIDARGQRSIVDETIEGATANLNAHLFTNSLPLAKDMILGGQGIGLYTKMGFRAEVMTDRLKFVPLDNEFLNRLKVGILISAKRSLTPIKHLLATDLSKMLKSIQLDS